MKAKKWYVVKIRWFYFILFHLHGFDITPYIVHTIVAFLDSVLTKVHWSDCLTRFFRRSNGDFCVAPNKGGCSPPDGSYLIFTKREGTAWFFFSPKMELFITSAARKKFVHRVTVFLFYFVSYVLLFLVLFMNGIWILIDYFRCQNFSSDAPTFSQLTPTSLRCYSPFRLDPLRFSFFGDRLLCTCTNIFRERKH